MTGWHGATRSTTNALTTPPSSVGTPTVPARGVAPIPVGAVETSFAVRLRTHTERQAFVRMVAQLRG